MVKLPAGRALKGDGHIDIDEFMLIDKAVKAAKGQTWDVSREQAARQQFNELDKDGNKSLSEEEFIEYYAVSTSMAEQPVRAIH